MASFLRMIPSVMFALILGLCPVMTGAAKDLAWIDSEQRFIVLMGFTMLFASYQVWLKLPKVTSRGAVEDRREVAEFFLRNLLNSYYEKLKDRVEQRTKGTDTIYPAVRANMMLPTRGFWADYLQIYFDACPPSPPAESMISYSGQEKSLRWKRGQGTCGHVWKSGKWSPYDSKEFRLRGLKDSLTPEQKSAVSGLKSVLTAPVWYQGKVVGIINLDSTASTERTFFEDPEIRALIMKCAESVAPYLFGDPVERTD